MKWSCAKDFGPFTKDHFSVVLCVPDSTWINAVTQELAHTSLACVRQKGPLQVDVYFPLREVNVKKDGDSSAECSTKNTEHFRNLDSLFSSDDTGSDSSLLQPDMTFQPTGLLKKRLANANRTFVDRMYNFGRGGSPFCGFPVEDDTGSLSSLLHLTWLCKPLFNGNFEHNVGSDKENNFCTLLQALGAASDRNVQWDVVKKLTTKYFNRESTSHLQAREWSCPADILTTMLVDFSQDYVNQKIGVVVQETLQTGPCTCTRNHPMICIQGHESGSLRTMMESDTSNCSVTGPFFWVRIGMDSTNFFCEPQIRIDTSTYFLLGFIVGQERDGKKQWVATVRDGDDRFVVMDHATCEPKLYPMQHRGLRNARLLLYGETKPHPPTWLRPPLPRKSQSEPLDMEALRRDGLVTGSVPDLLTLINKPKLQSILQEGVQSVLAKVAKNRGSVDKLGFVQGWPMPEPNDISLVYPSKCQKQHDAGSTYYTQELGKVRLQSWVTSPKVEGIHLLVCFFFFVVCLPNNG